MEIIRRQISLHRPSSLRLCRRFCEALRWAAINSSNNNRSKINSSSNNSKISIRTQVETTRIKLGRTRVAEITADPTLTTTMTTRMDRRDIVKRPSSDTTVDDTAITMETMTEARPTNRK